MARILLLIPTTSYRASDFLAAAKTMAVDVTVGSDETQVLEAFSQGGTATIDFDDLMAGVAQIEAFHKNHPLAAIVAVDERTGILAARAAAALGLAHNSVDAVEISNNKHKLRRCLSDHGLPTPHFEILKASDDPAAVAAKCDYPCVLKPLSLSGSRGVIRADNESEFVAAFNRIAKILTAAGADDQILVEGYLIGEEVAFEGLLVDGILTPLAIFDKPDPLEGPYFEETIYVTPSRHSKEKQDSIAAMVQQAAAAMGLREGPVHAELRVRDTGPETNERGPWIIEIAARSIGGLCSRSLSFGNDICLEEIILSHAIGRPIPSLIREDQASGVMMIPIPMAGILESVTGIEAAAAIDNITDVTISIANGQSVRPLPEGDRYLGFIFAKAETPKAVETALRQAHEALAITIEG